MATSNDTIGNKTCTKCGVEYPATSEYFNRDKYHPTGLTSQCKECRHKQTLSILYNGASADYQLAQEAKACGKKYCRKCKQQLPATVEYFWRDKTAADGLRTRCKKCTSERRLVYYSQNADVFRQYGREYAKQFPEMARLSTARRRARKLAADGEYSASDIQLQFKAQGGRCWWCGKKLKLTVKHNTRTRIGYDVDHRIPLTKGGSNDPSNLVLACPSCNSSKRDRLPSEWIGRLL